MEEQQMTPPQDISGASWDPEADGLAYNEPEPPDEPENEPETPEEDTNFSNPAEPDIDSDTDIHINDDGEVEYSDEFLGYEETEQSEQLEKPAKYTAEELKNIPFEQWDVERLDESIRAYVPIVKEQMMRRQMQQQIAQRPANPLAANAPQPYSPSELAEAAQKLACEKLGLDDPDDFDVYEGEHQAALKLAMDELSQKRNTEIAQYQRVSKDYQDLQKFNADLVKQPDYMEFDRWIGKKMQEAKVTPQQVEAGFQEYLRNSGGDYRGVQGVIAGWYKEFRQEHGGKVSRQRNTRPPVLEGTNGRNYAGRPSIDLSRFGELDSDSQADALMKMGLV